MLRFVCAQVNPGESAKRMDGSVWRFRESQIKLDNFIAVPIAGVLDIEFRSKCITGVQGRWGELQIAINKFRITQPMSEGVKRLAFKVAIGAVLHRVIIKSRQLLHALVEGYRQPARRIVHSRQ